ncbi:MAG: 2Fe-2S iron-sulfur cluster binding domain-containing protein, partial [Flavobacteriaceae bacterium]|nr:2Fe-2S iron-sulfur cluster binding domain-containing protein [Flavobacteriaceae bacterium]
MIEFILNDKHIKTNLNPGMTLLDFVRYEQRLTGTKIGCREGDCGACTVLVGSINEHENIDYESITSCLSPLGNAHGKHVVTIEGVNLKDKLNTAQQAMKDNYATQCGFCTPGFVVSLTGFAMANQEKTLEKALDAVSGNICRCTGYKSIERAAKQLGDKIEFTDSTKSLDWLIDREFIPDYFSGMADRLKALKIESPKYSTHSFVSGGTDLYVQKADDLIDSDVHLIFDQPDLKNITIENDHCTIGAGCTVSDLWNHKELNAIFPDLKKHLKLVSSEQIRNMASLGGNLVNASPIGDMTIFFLALDAEILLKNSEENSRSLALKKFYNGYKTYDLNPGEIIKDIRFKVPKTNAYFNFEKVCKRTHLDIA